MRKTKKKVALLTGGYTSEYPISVKSASNVATQLSAEFDVYTIYITPGSWHYLTGDQRRIEVEKSDFSIALQGQKILFDVIFICIHGSPGEDGRLQAYFDLLNIPYTSCRQLTASVTMNKYFTKAIVADLPELHLAKSVLLTNRKSAEQEISAARLRFPLFVKPNNGGSSIGLSKVKNEHELTPALDKAFTEDVGQQILVEEFIDGREISVGVFRSQNEISVLPPSEVVIQAEFFDFETKYQSANTIEITPARLSPDEAALVERSAKRIFTRLACFGVVRIDFILQATTGHIHFLEINTIPGQTDQSFIPKQLRAAGIDVQKFFVDLVNEALSISKAQDLSAVVEPTQ